MDTSKLKKFAQYARRSLMEQVSVKLKLALTENSAARRENPAAVKELEEALQSSGPEQIVERVAYIWFNRFCALRFMDVNRYSRVGILSPPEGQFQPEILADAKSGHIDEEMVAEPVRQKVQALLQGKISSPDGQGEAYRLLVVAVCNYWHRVMPFLFQRISDYTELLMPDDLLSGNSIIAYTREAMTPDACENVEVIGWLYQFYISEKKEQVFADLKKNKKITPDNIPAATQLFTPHWIVRYLVENSLGRLWLLNRPNSGLARQMPYYIRPEQPESDFLRVTSPEEIKICDPACGSGHMLTYAFDLLYAIYEEEGYEPGEIPEKILTLNLYGIEIDERAGELAAFALIMKARAKQRRFFNKPVQPHICVLENVAFSEDELEPYLDRAGRDFFSLPLIETLHQFEEAKNFGALIRPAVTDVAATRDRLEDKGVGNNLLLHGTHQKVLKVLDQADYLGQKYHVVIANPPYMGGKGMNGRLSAWLKDNYEDVKSDLFSAFIVRNTKLALPKGQLGFMSPFVWMFISSYEKLRNFLIQQKTITSLIQLEYSGFDGATVPVCTFTIENAYKPDFKGGYVRLSDFKGADNQEPKTLEAIANPDCGWFFRASAGDFRKIPGSPVAYWVSDKMLQAFEVGKLLGNIAFPKTGMTTGNNDRFLRLWHETISGQFNQKWFPYCKGGGYRRWYGYNEYLVNWENDGYEIKNNIKDIVLKASSVRSENLYFKPLITWSAVTSGTFSCRNVDGGALFDSGGSSISVNRNKLYLLALLNGKLAQAYLDISNATLNYQPGDIAAVPVITSNVEQVETITEQNITLSRTDWDSFETSWDFKRHPLLAPFIEGGAPQGRGLRLYSTNLKPAAQELRTNATRQENHLWYDFLRKFRPRFTRQRIVGRYILDFFCPKAMLALELDGSQHYQNEAIEYDNARTKYLNSFGIEVIRFQNREIDNNFESVCGRIAEVVRDKTQPPALRATPFKEGGLIAQAFDAWKSEAAEQFDTLKANEEELNRIFIEAYGLQDELTPDVPLAEITLTCNPHYRYGGNKTDEELEALLLADTMREFISYAVGCMFGRYALEKPGLILANQGETIEDYLKQIPKPSFPADDDNVIPILDGEWFTDDIVGRFREFLRLTFGPKHYEENLAFIEEALGKDLRAYFTRDFYNDHVRRYKKRPIYWLFSSPKGSFNALIYQHRYRPDTVSIILNDYLREFRAKLVTHKNHLEAVSTSAGASQGEKTKALKEIEKVKKMITEMEEYERDILYPLATKQIDIDLDDGVKVNYAKFGKAVRAIPGLDTKED